MDDVVPTPGDFLVWQPVGQAIRVAVHPHAARRMREEVLRAAENGLPEASGGLLLGATEHGETLAVTVEDIEPVAWPNAVPPRGGELESALQARAAGETGRSVVGYYRTDTREDLYLNAGDMALIRICFPDPANVFLLLKPGQGETVSSRLFFWQGGALRSDAGSGEYPFGLPVDQLLRPEFDEPPRPLRRNPRLLRAAAAAGLAVAAVTLPLAGARWYLSHPPPAPAGSSAASTRPLSLEVDKRPTDLVVRWNGAAPAINGAERAVLYIRDGPFRRSWDIDLDQLRTGSLYYAPLGGDLEFRLEVWGRGAGPVVESVRVLSGGLVAATALPPEQPETPRPAPPLVPEPVRKTVPPPREADTVLRPRTIHYTYGDDDPPAAGVTGPRAIRQVNPAVPRNRLGDIRDFAEVGVKVRIDRAGRVVDAQVVSQKGAPSRLLADSALSAARMWRFEPALRGGRPIPSDTVLNFRLTP